jgi:cytoskeletal protein CcmA (bactofilin family)
MLPNFRKSDTDTKQGASAVSGQTSTFPARPILATERQGARAMSVIGPDLIITGNLVSKGQVQIDGTIEGDIHGSHVIVGESANVTGGIVAEEVVIRGHVMGSVRSKRVMLQSTSQVDGDIFHNALSIEQGAMFEGRSRRTADDPRTGAAPLNNASPTPPLLPQH